MYYANPIPITLDLIHKADSMFLFKKYSIGEASSTFLIWIGGSLKDMLNNNFGSLEEHANDDSV